MERTEVCRQFQAELNGIHVHIVRNNEELRQCKNMFLFS